MRMLVFILVLLFSTSRYDDLSPLYLVDKNTFGALSYQFIHLSLFHLLTNIYFIYLYWRTFDFRPTIFIMSYVISALCGFYLQSSTPTVGSSGIAFSIVGFYLANTFSFDREFAKTAFSIAIFVAIQGLLNKSVNCPLHFGCLIVSFITYLPWTLKKSK